MGELIALGALVILVLVLVAVVPWVPVLALAGLAVWLGARRRWPVRAAFQPSVPAPEQPA